MSNPNAAIYFAKDGRCHIEGNLIFSPKSTAIHIEESANTQFVISNNTMLFTHPKWYQLRQWWNIIQLIRNHTRKS